MATIQKREDRESVSKEKLEPLQEKADKLTAVIFSSIKTAQNRRMG